MYSQGLLGRGMPPPQRKYHKVFFSFHYDEDIWRVGQVRNAGMIPGVEEAGFLDAAAWESLRRTGDVAVRSWIDSQLDGTSVTAVLIGSGTYGRPYVEYEILSSVNRGNGLLGIYIDQCEDQSQRISMRGQSPFLRFRARDLTTGKGFLPFSPISEFLHGSLDAQVAKYCWKANRGFQNLGDWIDVAAKQVGK